MRFSCSAPRNCPKSVYRIKTPKWLLISVISFYVFNNGKIRIVDYEILRKFNCYIKPSTFKKVYMLVDLTVNSENINHNINILLKGFLENGGGGVNVIRQHIFRFKIETSKTGTLWTLSVWKDRECNLPEYH